MIMKYNFDKIDNSNAQVKIAEPNISVVKTSDKQKYEYYENATYSIVITNNGIETPTKPTPINAIVQSGSPPYNTGS